MSTPRRTFDQLREYIPRLIWYQLELDGECFLWTGRVASRASGRQVGIVYYKGRTRSVHRLVWDWTRPSRKLQPRQLLIQACGNPRCVRPRHLRRVSRKELARTVTELPRHNTSGARNVYWNKQRQNWVVRIKRDGRDRYFGSYTNFDDAVEEAEYARRVVYGELTPEA